MQNRILCGVILFLSIILIIEVSFKKETNFFLESSKPEEKEPPKEEKKEIFIKLKNNNEITEINLEDYIVGVVAAEMPASFEPEALKAQAIASRSYAMYKKNHQTTDYDVVAGVSDQAYNTVDQMKAKWGLNFEANYQKIKDAVNQTTGQVLKYNNEIIEAFYFAMSNGYTEKSELVFQEELPYITSVESTFDNESLNNYEVTKTFSKEEFCTLLNISCEQIEIGKIERTDSKRINKIVINQKEFRGVEVRKLLTLRSTDFDIEVGDNINITTRGSGHGVGMSQYGANGMAKNGSDYTEILNHYYQNIEISKI